MYYLCVKKTSKYEYEVIKCISIAHKTVTEILSAHRMGFKHSDAGKKLPELLKITKNLGKYGVIVFEDYNSYLNMDRWNRDLLDKYCLSYNVRVYHMFSQIL